MTDDATLTDFLGGDGADADGSEADVDDATGDGADTTASLDVAESTALDGDEDDGAGDDALDDVDPARATYAWGVERSCGACGRGVERWWRDGGEVACLDCKEW